jgi:lysine 2,3-aminomutase
VTHIRQTKALVKAGLIEPAAIADIEKVTQKFSVAMTSQVVAAINNGSEEAAEILKKQFLPSIEELVENPMELTDPIGDKPHEVVRGIIHRYPDRCLLMPIQSCPVYCRFCFRRENVGKKKEALTETELTAAFSYINAHPEIWEVILSGGDPLILKPKTLREILLQLEKIPHVEVVRIHTRVPIVDSLRVTAELIRALKIKKAVYVIVHVNHAIELSEIVVAACARLIDAGIPMLSQTVLLKGVNDTVEAMGQLMRSLVKNRIKPYYVHHGDLARGTSHFRTTVASGKTLMKALRGYYSGLCQPTYVLDIPGGYGKVPIEHDDYCVEKKSMDNESACYSIEDYQGKIHEYRGC